MHRAWMRVKRRLHERRLWSKARTLEDLGELTAQWLEGRIAHQPGYYGPVDVDEDLVPGMRDTLVQLNRAGFVTNSSQAGYDNAGWTSHAAVTGFARDETVRRLRQALQGSEYVAFTDDYTDRPDGIRGIQGIYGIDVTFLDGQPYTNFGSQLVQPEIQEIYPGVSDDAIDDLCGLSQLTIYDPQTGRNTLWAALDEAVRQPEQENTTVTSSDDGPRDSVGPGLHNAPGSRYNHDPRVKADGSGGYTVTTEDRTLQVRYDQQHGWGVHNEDGERLSGGHADPDSLIHTLIGAPHRRDTAGNIHERQPQDNSGPAASPDAADPSQDDPDPRGYRDADHLRHLADRCEAGAADLQRAADDPAGVLAERGYHDLPDVEEWAARKAAAAAVAREYAAHLRTMADDPSYQGQFTTPERFAEAEKVATAAECDGILIDGTRLTQSAIEHGWHDEAGKQALRDHQAAEDAAITGSGLFEHVAETINGVVQVPFWQLGGNTHTNEHTAPDNANSGDTATADADPSDQGQEATMNGRDNLTPEQDRLYQGVLAIGRQNGMTCAEVLRLSGAANTDKAAVADAIAGTGAGDEFREQDSQQSRGVDHAGQDNDTTSEAPSGGEQAARGNADDGTDSTDNTGSGSVAAHADAGETVNIPGDAVGSRGFISDAGGRGSTSTAGTSTAGSGSGSRGQVNIGAVTSRGGQVHAGGDITGQKNTAIPQPRRQAESGSDSGDGW